MSTAKELCDVFSILFCAVIFAGGDVMRRTFSCSIADSNVWNVALDTEMPPGVWPFVGKSIPTIPIESLEREESVDLATIIPRIVRLKVQSRRRNHSNFDSPVKILAVTFREDKIDMVIFEFG